MDGSAASNGRMIAFSIVRILTTKTQRHKDHKEFLIADCGLRIIYLQSAIRNLQSAISLCLCGSLSAYFAIPLTTRTVSLRISVKKRLPAPSMVKSVGLLKLA